MAIYFNKREIVVPGQLLAEGRYQSSVGTYDEDGRVFSALVGLAELRGNTVKVVPLEGVYIPREDDLVIGTITIVAGNNWKVDIGGPYLASLHANNALRRPYDEDISVYFGIGDLIAAEIISFDRNSGPFLTLKGRGLSKLEDGMVLDVGPSKIPRIIGRRGSMINMIKDQLRIRTVVAQNGKIWIQAPNFDILRVAVKAFRMIEDEAHTANLTDRVARMISEELDKLDGKSDKAVDMPEPEPEPIAEESAAEETPPAEESPSKASESADETSETDSEEPVEKEVTETEEVSEE